MAGFRELIMPTADIAKLPSCECYGSIFFRPSSIAIEDIDYDSTCKHNLIKDRTRGTLSELAHETEPGIDGFLAREARADECT